MFIILSGSSGAGKNTIISNLVKQNKNYIFFLTNTTREKRASDANNQVYNFLTKDEFQKKIKSNDMIEHEIIHGNFYGTSWDEFNANNKKGHILFKDIGVQGTFNIAEKCREKTKVVKIFLYCPKRVLIKRLKNRKENDIKLRMKRFKYENSFKYKYDYLINNNNFDRTLFYINQIIKIKDEPENILPIKNLDKLNSKKIGKYMEDIKTGKQLKPVKIAINKNGIYLLNGTERFIAAVKMKKDICKIINNKNVQVDKHNNIETWKNLLKN